LKWHNAFKRIASLIAQFLELIEHAVEILVLVIEVLAEVAEHELREVNLSDCSWPFSLKTIPLAA